MKEPLVQFRKLLISHHLVLILKQLYDHPSALTIVLHRDHSHYVRCVLKSWQPRLEIYKFNFPWSWAQKHLDINLASYCTYLDCLKICYRGRELRQPSQYKHAGGRLGWKYTNTQIHLQLSQVYVFKYKHPAYEDTKERLVNNLLEHCPLKVGHPGFFPLQQTCQKSIGLLSDWNFVIINLWNIFLCSIIDGWHQGEIILCLSK